MFIGALLFRFLASLKSVGECKVWQGILAHISTAGGRNIESTSCHIQKNTRKSLLLRGRLQNTDLL